MGFPVREMSSLLKIFPLSPTDDCDLSYYERYKYSIYFAFLFVADVADGRRGDLYIFDAMFLRSKNTFFVFPWSRLTS